MSATLTAGSRAQCFFPSYNRQHQETHPSLDFDYDAVRAVKTRFTQDLIHRHIALLVRAAAPGRPVAA